MKCLCIHSRAVGREAEGRTSQGDLSLAADPAAREAACAQCLLTEGGRAPGCLRSGCSIAVLISSAAVPTVRERAAAIHEGVQQGGGLQEGWEGGVVEGSSTGVCQRTAVCQPGLQDPCESLGFHAKYASVPEHRLNLFPECYIRSGL